MIFNCGKNALRKGKLVGDYKVQKISDIVEKIIPFFNKYQIQGVKSEDFKDFCKVADIISKKQHLTLDGMKKI